MKTIGLIAVLLIVPGIALAGHGYGHCNAQNRAAFNHGDYHHQQHPHQQADYSVGGGLRELAIAEKAAEKAVADALAKNNADQDKRFAKLFSQLRSELLKFQGSGTFVFQGGGGDQPGPTPVPVPVPIDPTPNPQPIPDNGGEGPAFTPEFSAIVATRCAKCHNANGPQAAIDPSNTDAYRASLIFLRTFSDKPGVRMPPDGNMTDQERQQVFEWATQQVQKGR